MPITPTAVLAPIGDFEPQFIEDENVPSASNPNKTELQLRLESYITQGYARPDISNVAVEHQDELVRLWTLYRAYDAAYMIKNNKPRSENQSALGLPSEAWQWKQIEAFKTKRDGYLSYFNSKLAQVLVTNQPVGYFGGARPTKFEY